MPRKSRKPRKQVRFPAPPRSWQGVAILLGILIVLIIINNRGCGRDRGPEPRTGPGDYLFCFWNVENLFDDRDDNRSRIDEQYDDWFAHDVVDRQEKYAHVADALVRMNGGRGPDLLALVEVETIRAAELLRDALNARLSDPALHYRNVLMKEVAVGRHIAPALITRLDVDVNRTRQLGGARFRIIRAVVRAADHELFVIASHWTSRVTDETGDGRDKYADQIYGEVREMRTANPAVDVLICGDFNDSPEDDSVKKYLRAVGDPLVAMDSAPEQTLLVNLFAGRDPKEFGTHVYSGNWLIYDQIVVTPGMLDGRGWTCDAGTLRVADEVFPPRPSRRSLNGRQHPWPFGREKNDRARGYSDHLPVTVWLKVTEQ
jgi:endonuclease/exonuclease/phosphatase family metal-dependent hydrolase